MRGLTRRGGLAALLGSGAALAAARGPARAALPAVDQATVDRIEAYLNGVRTLQARFSQVNPDGSASNGEVYIDRERGAMRFAYDPPSQIELVAPGDWRLIFVDASIRQVNVLPVSETPLGFLLAKRIEIGGDIQVTGLQYQRGEIQLSATRKGAADQGRVLLAFIERPLELRRWAVTDAQGLTTVVILEGVKLNAPIDGGVFTWRDPKIFGWGRE
jgi:outer membrane lipoprotein-sorting protein